MTATTVFDELRDALAQMEFDGTAVGIDLGTTKSCIAVARFEDGELVCECQTIDEPGQPEGQIAVPSVVAVKPGAVLLNSICLGMTTSTDTRPGSPQPCTANAA